MIASSHVGTRGTGRAAVGRGPPMVEAARRESIPERRRFMPTSFARANLTM